MPKPVPDEYLERLIARLQPPVYLRPQCISNLYFGSQKGYGVWITGTLAVTSVIFNVSRPRIYCTTRAISQIQTNHSQQETGVRACDNDKRILFTSKSKSLLVGTAEQMDKFRKPPES
jgi:hypothetical protein